MNYGSIFIKSDMELKRDVMDELKWEPSVKTELIGVAVKDGLFTLSGDADSYFKSLSAEHAAQRVFGIRSIVQEIKVKHITRAAANVLEEVGHKLAELGKNYGVSIEVGCDSLELNLNQF